MPRPMEMLPDRFEDIIALVALHPPGSMAKIPTYCACKHGKEQPDTSTRSWSRCCARPSASSSTRSSDEGRAAALRLFARRSRSAASRDGQEDPLRNGGAAQALRRRRGERGVEKGQAEAIFELLARFADYGFNKAMRRPMRSSPIRPPT